MNLMPMPVGQIGNSVPMPVGQIGNSVPMSRRLNREAPAKPGASLSMEVSHRARRAQRHSGPSHGRPMCLHVTAREILILLEDYLRVEFHRQHPPTSQKQKRSTILLWNSDGCGLVSIFKRASQRLPQRHQDLSLCAPLWSSP